MTRRMHAFLEWFCEHGGMVRIGPKAFVYDDDYTFSVGFKVEGNLATLTGTHAPAGGITTAHKRAACEALERENYKVIWKHREPNPDPALSTSGVKPMRTVMGTITKHVDHSKNADGTHDQAKVIEATEEALAHMKSGKLIVEPVAQFKHGGKTFKVFATNE